MLHRTVAFVFKLIGITIVLLIVSDTVVMLGDAYMTNARIQAQANLMQQEIAKNNYLSESATHTFEQQLTQIDGLSNVYGNIPSGGVSTTPTGGIRINSDYAAFKISSTSNDEIIADIGEVPDEVSDVKNYGDYHVLIIEADFNPWHYYYSGGEIKRTSSSSHIHYYYTIPCLRYLK